MIHIAAHKRISPHRRRRNCRGIDELLTDHTELFKQFSDNPGFKKWLADTIFTATYQVPST